MNLFALAVLFCAYVLVPVINWPVLQSLLARWSDDGQPGYAVVALSLYFGWRLLQRCAAMPARPSLLAAVLLFGASFLSLAGFAAQVQVVQQVALWLQIGLWIAAVFGWSTARLMLPAWLMLLFSIPLFDFLTDPLRVMAVAVTRLLLSLGDIPAFIDGYYIAVPAGRFFVAGGCSGLNFLISGVMIGYLHAYLHFSHRWRQLAVILLAAACAVIGNWVRIGALVLIGYYTDMQSGLIASHGEFGWWIFVGAMALFFLLSHYLALGDPRHGKAVRPNQMAPQPVLKLAGWASAMLLLVALLPVWLGWQQQVGSGQPRSPAMAMHWQVVDSPTWRPQFEGFDTAHFWRVRQAGRDFDLQVLTYFEQHQGKEMIYYRNAIAAEDDRLVQTVAISGPALTMNQSVVSERGAQRLVWWFYRIGGQTTTRDDLGKALQLLALIEGRPTASLVALSLRCNSPLCQSELASSDLALARDQLLQQLLAATDS